jgi:hypothetical protein
MSVTGQEQAGAHKAGAFDVRNVIAGLIGIYGVVLVVMGLFATGADDRAKTGGVNANLWSGIVMVVVAAAFLLWSRLRPVVVDEAAVAEAREDDDRPPH